MCYLVIKTATCIHKFLHICLQTPVGFYISRPCCFVIIIYTHSNPCGFSSVFISFTYPQTPVALLFNYRYQSSSISPYMFCFLIEGIIHSSMMPLQICFFFVVGIIHSSTKPCDSTYCKAFLFTSATFSSVPHLSSNCTYFLKKNFIFLAAILRLITLLYSVLKKTSTYAVLFVFIDQLICIKYNKFE